MFVLVVERVVLLVGMPGETYYWLNYATDARADTLLVGCAAAIVLGSKLIPQSEGIRVALKYSVWLIGVPGLLLIGILAGRSAEFCAIGLHITTALFAVLVLIEVVISEREIPCRVLSQRWLVGIGKVSYGLYLWHYPIFCEVQARHFPMQKEVAIEVALTILATVTSFYLIERPALKLKSRFRPAKHENAK
jgi:peptidoglycan/LPS O-acetylase OafA/YrhL